MSKNTAKSLGLITSGIFANVEIKPAPTHPVGKAFQALGDWATKVLTGRRPFRPLAAYTVKSELGTDGCVPD